MFDFGSQWGLLTVVGPIVLIIALVWAMTHNKSTRREKRHTEEATRANYDRQAAEDKLREDL